MHDITIQDRPYCGTITGYTYHRTKYQEPACSACKAAWNAYYAARRGESDPTPADCCGTKKGFSRHHARGERACDKCLEANRFHYTPSLKIWPTLCLHCGACFIARRPHQKFCSVSCSHRRHELLKRGLVVRGERYTLQEIGDRDGWRCHLCGKRVPNVRYSARDTDPTIDHLVPTSAGGHDTKSNVALAHNRCNWERGNTGAAQLLLWG